MALRWSALAGLVVAAMAIGELVGDAAAATYVVGDNVGWKVSPGGASDYANWASRHVFRVGDVLEFNFTTGYHTVAQVTKASFDACNTNVTKSITTNGPANITLNSTGENLYICTIGQHCLRGQKLAINVTASSNSTATMNSCTSFVVLASSVIYGLVVM